jgi:hypothetical protein
MPGAAKRYAKSFIVSEAPEHVAKLRIAIHNPIELSYIKKNQTQFSYVIEYIRKYRPLIYLSRPPRSLRYFFWKPPRLSKKQVIERLREQGIEYSARDIITDAKELDRRADALIGFHGEYFVNKPEARFHGMKIYHLQDYLCYCKDNYRALQHAHVDYVFCHSKLDVYSPLLRKEYPAYIGKVISIPFGFAPRFESKRPFGQRKNTVFVTGSINPLRITDLPVKELLVTVDGKIVQRQSTIKEKIVYYIYYHLLIRRHSAEIEKLHPKEKWLHPFRRKILEQQKRLKGIADVKLPAYPQIKRYDLNLVDELNAHTMFNVDDGHIDFVGAKAYEGMACGGVLVCPDAPQYAEFGFVDGENCVKYRPNDMKDFIRKVKAARKDREKLQRMAEAGHQLVTEKFTHKAIADLIQQKTEIAYKEWRKRSSKSLR